MPYFVLPPENPLSMQIMLDIQLHKQQVEEAVAFLLSQLPILPEVLIQLGTGLGGLAQTMSKSISIPYANIPHFPSPTVESHAGKLVCGNLGGRRVAILAGRFHYYEGYSARTVAFPIRVLSFLGVKTALITNASGGLNPTWQPGTIMVMQDHINLLPDSPLRGPNVDEWGPRFPDLSQPYSLPLRTLTLQLAEKLGLDKVQSGTYVCIPGPSLETPAETRMLRQLGADAVGMSSLPEVITALHAGLRVVGLSVVANINDPDNFAPLFIEDIIAAAQEAEPRLQQLISALIQEL